MYNLIEACPRNHPRSLSVPIACPDPLDPLITLTHHRTDLQVSTKCIWRDATQFDYFKEPETILPLY